MTAGNMYTRSELDALSVLVDFTSGLSLLGCLFILLVYLFFKELRVFAFKLVLHMTLCDSIRCLGFLLQHADSSLCETQGVLIQAGSLGSILWNGVIARTLYLSVVAEIRDVEKKEGRFTAGVYALVALLTGLPWITRSYGDAVGWCWIKGDDGKDYLMGNVWRGVCFYLPLFLVFLNNFYSYYHVISTLRSNFSHPEVSSLINKLRFYPIILILCYILVLSKRIYNLAQPSINDFPFAVIAAISLGSIGFIDAVIYGFNPTVRGVIRQRLCPSAESRSGSNVSEDAINFI